MMEGAHILGYEDSPNFLGEEDFPRVQELGYVLRQAKDECGLHGVYVLKAEKTGSPLPILYYCQANTEADAKRIHRLVWNQGIVPFVLVETRAYLRVYPGFRFSTSGSREADDTLRPDVPLNDVLDQLAAFQAAKIDDGTLLKEWGSHVTPDTRVDWTLLRELNELDTYLQQCGIKRGVSHAIIGKFVYFRYLRDRDIISDLKLAQWGIPYEAVFSRTATLDSFLALDRHTHEWLNGSIFPSDPEVLSSISPSLFQRIAGAFVGDTDEQLHLDFEPYNFSFIPIETLSVIYQQFLHLDEPGKEISRGRKLGAYYTPLPLISFIHEELEKKYPLTRGMTILDPSCGSGSFLVQCYRRLIEKERQESRRPLTPAELQEILTEQIFGVEQDSDACSIAELSLVLTLLDYVKREDLESRPNFLPNLRNKNIFEADFFDPNSSWASNITPNTFDWIIGNPPWYRIKGESVPKEYHYVWEWMQAHRRESPTGGNQVAEAFVWKVLSYLKPHGVVGLVLPAMTLFKKESKRFRKAFFRKVHTWCIANFANLAEVLFGGRARRPAMVAFFQHRNSTIEKNPDEVILTFGPLIINQESNRPDTFGTRKTTWAITVNAGEVQEIYTDRAATGETLPWKIAMWGSFRDEKLLKKVERFPIFKDFRITHGLSAHEGFQLRKQPAQIYKGLEFRPDLVGKKRINFKRLHGQTRIFVFPEHAIDTISETECYVRRRGGLKGLHVSFPPHIIVDAGRRFAFYSNEFIAVPPRQIGIAPSLENKALPRENETLLKALALYLNSDFVLYHQFFIAQEWGISTTRATLDALNYLPIPLDTISHDEVTKWAEVWNALITMSQPPSIDDALITPIDRFEQAKARHMSWLNDRVFYSLGLRDSERILIRDFLAMDMQCIQGKVTKQTLGIPSESTMRRYMNRLKMELDAFIEGESELQHKVTSYYDPHTAMLEIRLIEADAPSPSLIEAADKKMSHEFGEIRERLKHRHSQWMYFNRNLQIHDLDTTYCFKPMQAIQWTERQAILDASNVIAETLISNENR